MNNMQYVVMINFANADYPLLVTADKQHAVNFGNAIASTMQTGKPTQFVWHLVADHGLADWFSVTVIEFTDHMHQRPVQRWGADE